MNCETKIAFVSTFVYFVACSMSPNAMQAQEAASSHFGASAPRSASASGGIIPVRGTGVGGGSSWGVGKGSFGSSAQPGGVWRDGSTLGASAGAAHSTAQPHAPAAEPFSAGGDLAVPSSGAKTPSFRGNAASGTAHLFRSSSVRGSTLKSSRMGHAVGGSRGRPSSLGRGAGNAGTRQSSGLTTGLTQHGLPQRSAARTFQPSGLDTRLSK
jgi:hypothetical protein